MAMPKVVHDALAAALKDVKFPWRGEEASAMDVLGEWFDSDEAKDPLKKANDDLTKKRDKLRAELDELKTSTEKGLADLKAENERLLKSQLSDEDKKKLEALKGSGMTSEAEARFNKVTADLETITKRLDESEKARNAERETAAKARLDVARQKLRGEIVDALGKVKVTGNNAKLAIAGIMQDGLVNVEFNEDGTEKRTVHIQKDGKTLAATVDDLAKHFAETNPSLVDSSGNAGAGMRPVPGGNGIVDHKDKTLVQVNDEYASRLAAPTAAR